MTNVILNLTQHPASPEQVNTGVINVSADDKSALTELLTFTSLPSAEEVKTRALSLVDLAFKYGATAAMIGGAPYLMPALHLALQTRGVKPLYAYSERVSIETTQPDGSVVKTAVFKHKGFVSVDIEL